MKRLSKPRERTLYRETYRKEAVWNDFSTLTALQKLERFNGRVESCRLLAAGRVDTGDCTETREYVEIRIYIAPYSNKVGDQKKSPWPDTEPREPGERGDPMG